MSAAKPNIDAWWTPAATPDHPEADGPIDGVMMWQGDIVDKKDGRSRRIFIIREAERRHFWGVSERTGIAELRRVANGTRVWIACKGRRDTGNVIAGRRQMVLDFELYVERLQDRPVVVAAPISDATAIPSAPGDDDVPF